jgi:long-chain fatty acid transport protein
MRILLAAVMLAPAAALANGYHLPITNPRDMAFGGSGTAAIQNSASAVYANPAALAGLDGLNVVGDLEMITLTSRWQDITGQVGAGSSVSTTPKANFPPGLYVSYGDKLGGRNVAVGLGATVSGGGAEPWPASWPGRTEIITVERRSWAFDLAAAYQPIDMLKVAIGGVYMRSSEKLIQGLDFLSSQGDVQLGTAGGAFTFHLGGELQPLEGLKIGIDYRHKATQNLEGDAHFGHVPATFQVGTPPLIDGTATHQLVFPNILQTGASYQITPDLLVNVGYIFVRWIVYDQDVFVGSTGLTVTVPHRYTNSFGFSGGAEYKLPAIGGVSGLVVRAGIERISSPQPTDTLHPAIPDANSTSFCFGAGYKVNENLAVDAGYKLAVLDTITSTGAEAFPGRYDTTAHFLSAGVTYRFGGTGSAARAEARPPPATTSAPPPAEAKPAEKPAEPPPAEETPK